MSENCQVCYSEAEDFQCAIDRMEQGVLVKLLGGLIFNCRSSMALLYFVYANLHLVITLATDNTCV